MSGDDATGHVGVGAEHDPGRGGQQDARGPKGIADAGKHASGLATVVRRPVCDVGEEDVTGGPDPTRRPDGLPPWGGGRAPDGGAQSARSARPGQGRPRLINHIARHPRDDPLGPNDAVKLSELLEKSQRGRAAATA